MKLQVQAVGEVVQEVARPLVNLGSEVGRASGWGYVGVEGLGFRV